MKKLSYNTIYNRERILSHIPLKEVSAKSPSLAAAIMLMLVELRRHIKTFEEDMQKTATGLMPEGYQELAARVGSKNNPLTDEERARYDSETVTLEESYSKARIEHATDEVEVNRAGFSSKDFTDMMECIGLEGTVPGLSVGPEDKNPEPLPRMALLGAIAEFVD